MKTCLITCTNWFIITCSLSCSMTLPLSENIEVVRGESHSKGSSLLVCFLNLTFSHFCYLLKILSQCLSLFLLHQSTCSAYLYRIELCYNPFFLLALSKIYSWIDFLPSLIVLSLFCFVWKFTSFTLKNPVSVSYLIIKVWMFTFASFWLWFVN